MSSIRFMKATCLLVAMLMFGACHRRAGGEDGVEKPTAESTSVSDALASVRQLKAKSYHILLRDAAQIFPPTCVGKPWADVTSAVEGRMCPLIETRDNGDHLQHFYLAEQRAVSFPNGRSFDAYVWLSGKNADGHGRPSRPEKVSQAKILLVDNTNADYEVLIKQDRYPRGTILDAVLRSPEVRQEGLRWPILKRVLVHYGPYISRYGVSHGFHVTVQFTASLEEEIGEKRMYFFAGSGLAPGGDDVDGADGDASQDTLSDVFGGGANEWWRGTANKEEYLKPER